VTVDRVQEQDGFGLVELLIALTVMAIGIMAIVAGFSSGILAVSRASQIATAGTLADKQMEAYRALGYKQIALNSTEVGAAASPYSGDAALSGSAPGNVDLTNSNLSATDYDGSYCTGSPVPATCKPVRTTASGSLTAPDGRSYRLDTYIVWSCASPFVLAGSTIAPTCTSGGTTALAVKQVTVVVRDGVTPATKTWFRETSTFDRNT
jgi:prepilin-type N-terminal cleavage/methylation domain-containing protein